MADQIAQDPYTASPDAGVAVLNTNIATAMSLLTWTCMDIVFYRKPSIIGAINGMITGLVAITPAAGVVAGWGAIIIGVCSGTVPWVSMNIMGKKWSLFTHHSKSTPPHSTIVKDSVVVACDSTLCKTLRGIVTSGIQRRHSRSSRPIGSDRNYYDGDVLAHG